MTTNRQWLLASRPSGVPTQENFRLVEAPLPAPSDGEVLVRVHYMSLDPYMRGRMDDSKSYAAPQALGAVMQGRTAGEVIASRVGLAPGPLNPKRKFHAHANLPAGVRTWGGLALVHDAKVRRPLEPASLEH